MATASAQGWNCEGGLVELNLVEVLHLIESDMMHGVHSAKKYRLRSACELSSELVEYCFAVLRNGSNGKGRKDWRCMMNKRISESYKAKNPDLIWLDDKVEQVATTASLCGQHLHLPITAHATQSDLASEESLCGAVRRQIALGEPFVVKPRHGSNSKHVRLWSEPRATDIEDALDTVKNALNAYDKSWGKECWALNAVPKGALLQPLYAPISSFLKDPEKESLTSQVARPLELKVQVLFGEMVGGMLNTHSQYLWVTRYGAVHLWDQEDPGFTKRHAAVGHDLPSDALQALLHVLRRDWQWIRGNSEKLAREAGLDELRVDWLLGDSRWGPRIGELTYVGTFSLDVLPVSQRLARAFAFAHLSRLGHTLDEHCF